MNVETTRLNGSERSTVIVLNYHGYGHASDIARSIRERGKHVTMLAEESVRVPPDVCDEVVFLESFEDSSGILSAVRRYLADKLVVERIVNTTCYATHAYIHLLREFGDCSGYGEWYLNVRVKPEMRRILNERNVSHVEYSLIRSFNQLSELLPGIRFPCIVKPICGQGSDCVFKISGAEDAISKYRQIQDTKFEGIDVHYSKATINGRDYDLSKDVLLEEYLEGVEYMADGYVCENRASVVTVHQKYFSTESNGFRDRLFITPPENWDLSVHRNVGSVVGAACSVLGMNNTLFHIEFRMVNGEPKIIEINPRLSGGLMQENILATRGVSLIDIQTSMICGGRIPPIEVEPPKGVNFFFGIIVPRAGRLRYLHGLDRVRDMAEVKDLWVLIKPGDVVPDLIGERFILFCRCVASSHSEALELYRKIDSMITYAFE